MVEVSMGEAVVDGQTELRATGGVVGNGAVQW